MGRAARRAEALRQRREQRSRRDLEEGNPTLIWSLSLVLLTVGMLLGLFFVFISVAGDPERARLLWEGDDGFGLRHGIFLFVGLMLLSCLSALAGMFSRYRHLSRAISAISMVLALVIAIALFGWTAGA